MKGHIMSNKKLTPLPTDDKKPTTTRTQILPFIALIVIIVGFGYGVATFVRLFNNIPEFAQGAITVIIALLVLKIASDKE